MAEDSRSWGILGNPTPEQIQAWCNLPVGEFRRMVRDQQQKRKNTKTMQIEIKKIVSENKTFTTTVEYTGVPRKSGTIDFFHTDVLNKVRNGSMSVEWSEPVHSNDTVYQWRRIS